METIIGAGHPVRVDSARASRGHRTRVQVFLWTRAKRQRRRDYQATHKHSHRQTGKRRKKVRSETHLNASVQPSSTPRSFGQTKSGATRYPVSLADLFSTGEAGTER